MVSTRRAPHAGSEAPAADAASQQPAVPASATKARRTAATPAKASVRQSKAQQQQQDEEQEQHALGQMQAPADASTSQAEHEGRRGRRLNLGADADTMQHDQGSQRQPTVTAAATPARAAAATPLKSKAAPAPAPAGAASARPTAKSSTPLKAPAPQALPAAGDEDDDLLAIDMAQLAASIQQSLQQRQAQQAAAKAKAMEQKQKQSSDEEEEGEEDEEEETDAGEQEGAGPSGVEGEQAYEGTIKLHDAAGPSSAGAGDDEMQLVGQRLRLQEWVPQVAVPQGPKSTRLVHQREPVKGEKEQGLAKQLVALPRDPKLLSKEARKSTPDTAGRNWFDMPSVKVDEEMKRELRLLRLRGAYDPKRFYKSFDVTKFPKYFQMGTVVDNPQDFYGGRLPNSQRKGTLTEQLLADEQVTQARKKRYTKMQEEAQKYSRKRKGSGLPRHKKNVKHNKIH